MADLENRVGHLETKVSVIETKVDMFIQEMRDRDNHRAAEIAELRQKQEADMKEIRTSLTNLNTKIDNMGNHVRNVSIATIAVCIASVVGTVTMALTVIFK